MSAERELEATISDLKGTRVSCLHGGKRILGSWKAEQFYVGFTCGNFGSCDDAPEEKVGEGIKNGGPQKQKCSLGPSALFTGVNNYFSELSQLSARANAKRNGRPFFASERPATIFVLFFPSTRIFLTKAVYVVLGSS